MKYILCQVFNVKHALSQRIMHICDTLDEANEFASENGFGEFHADEKHLNTYITEQMLYTDDDDKVIGATQLVTMTYSDEDAGALATAQMIKDVSENDISDEDTNESGTEDMSIDSE